MNDHSNPNVNTVISNLNQINVPSNLLNSTPINTNQSFQPNINSNNHITNNVVGADDDEDDDGEELNEQNNNAINMLEPMSQNEINS